MLHFRLSLYFAYTENTKEKHTRQRILSHKAALGLTSYHFILFYMYIYFFFSIFCVLFSWQRRFNFCEAFFTFLITISTRISVFFEVAAKVKRAATMRSSYSLCSLRPLLFICIWVTDGCVVCVGQSPGGQRVEGRRVGGFHGQKLEANGKCKTFWGFLFFFFFIPLPFAVASSSLRPRRAARLFARSWPARLSLACN